MTPADCDRRMLEALVCPQTQTTLRYDAAAQELISEAAGLAFPIRDGIPILLLSAAREWVRSPGLLMQEGENWSK